MLYDVKKGDWQWYYNKVTLPIMLQLQYLYITEE